MANERWAKELTCSVTKQIWPIINDKSSKTLLQIGRPIIRSLVGITTEHCLMGAHGNRVGYPANDFSHGCRDKEEREGVEHYL